MTINELEEIIIHKIKEVFDPEIPVDVYELGLIYDVNIQKDHSVKVAITLTSPSCSVAEALPQQVKLKIKEIDTVEKVDIELTWTPSWNQSMMSEEAQLALGML